MTQPLRVLFVCRLNRHRSATAERLFCKREELDVRSAGTSEDAMVRINERMLDWADVIFVMDQDQQKNLKKMFPEHPALERIVCLDIPDQFGFNDPELVQLLQERVQPTLDATNRPGGAEARSGSPTRN
jgi:predicted protein tyrosine phosphatase